MRYDCIFHNGRFLLAKPHGWEWGSAEREAPFRIRVTRDLDLDAADDASIQDNSALILAGLEDA